MYPVLHRLIYLVQRWGISRYIFFLLFVWHQDQLLNFEQSAAALGVIPPAYFLAVQESVTISVWVGWVCFKYNNFIAISQAISVGINRGRISAVQNFFVVRQPVFISINWLDWS